jgi:hypothetical protein
MYINITKILVFIAPNVKVVYDVSGVAIKEIAKQFHATPEMWRRENRTKGIARLRFFGARAALAAKRIQSCYVQYNPYSVLSSLLI